MDAKQDGTTSPHDAFLAIPESIAHRQEGDFAEQTKKAATVAAFLHAG
ncbi:hypothetical protein [Slackia piriformis]